ncbi:IST1-like protein [Dirofilaria immitis]|nr:IST1-like protein [Dirofilaria immitis]
MSISWGTQYAKLKTNLRLAINRLKLLEKKKTEMALKSRTEIADFIANHKEDRARIRVEHIIREDFLVEAYELLEMYCDLILARFGLIQQMKQLDDGIAEAVINILWAAPRVATDVSEFKVINDQLTMKYGKTFAEAARNNQLEYPAKVSSKLIAKLSVQAPPKLLRGNTFTPDPNIMREDEVAAAEQMLIDFKNQGGQGYGWMYPDAYYLGPPPPAPAGFRGIFIGSDKTGIASAPMSDPTNYTASNYPRLSQNDDISGDKIKPNASPETPEFPEPPTDFPEMLESASFSSAKSNGEQKSGVANNSDELDFDDLAKRFDMLKRGVSNKCTSLINCMEKGYMKSKRNFWPPVWNTNACRLQQF